MTGSDHSAFPDRESQWLRDVTSIPTAAGREHRVIEWIARWVAARADLALRRDSAGNLVIVPAAAARGGRTLFITAHLDHPAFVVERVVGPGTLLATFRGGVMEPYFRSARVAVFAESEAELPVSRGTVAEFVKKEPFPECLIELDEETEAVLPGATARWDLDEPRIEGDLFYTHACDDLSAVAAALAVMDRLRGRPEGAQVRLLFTRAEEIGFIGAIAACRLGTMPRDARVIALENSRSFAESPIGAGPVVRVGDRLSVFNPALTDAIARVAEKIPAPFRWQRKLMPGGACEASVFQAYGYESTCVCLPLGNYHNMADLERVQSGDTSARASASPGPEFISVADYRNMITLLEACAVSLESVEPLTTRLERAYAEKKFVLE